LIGEAFQGLCHPRDRIDAVHPACLQQRRGGCPSAAATILSSEQLVFPCDCLGPDCALDNVGIELDAAVDQVALISMTSVEHTSDFDAYIY
jgi:hypothetical protein